MPCEYQALNADAGRKESLQSEVSSLGACPSCKAPTALDACSSPPHRPVPTHWAHANQEAIKKNVLRVYNTSLSDVLSATCFFSHSMSHLPPLAHIDTCTWQHLLSTLRPHPLVLTPGVHPIPPRPPAPTSLSLRPLPHRQSRPQRQTGKLRHVGPTPGTCLMSHCSRERAQTRFQK